MNVHAVDAGNHDDQNDDHGRQSPSVHSEQDDVRMEGDETDYEVNDNDSHSSHDDDDNYRPDDTNDDIHVHAVDIELADDDRTLITEDDESVFSALTLVEEDYTVNDPVMVAHAHIGYKTLDPR